MNSKTLASTTIALLLTLSGVHADNHHLPGDRSQLIRLLRANVVQLAVIDGAGPLPHPPAKADPRHELFAQHFQILFTPN